jgi:hypothetical protein
MEHLKGYSINSKFFVELLCGGVGGAELILMK